MRHNIVSCPAGSATTRSRTSPAKPRADSASYVLITGNDSSTSCEDNAETATSAITRTAQDRTVDNSAPEKAGERLGRTLDLLSNANPHARSLSRFKIFRVRAFCFDIFCASVEFAQARRPLRPYHPQRILPGRLRR
jgi:hypothetical protein